MTYLETGGLQPRQAASSRTTELQKGEKGGGNKKKNRHDVSRIPEDFDHVEGLRCRAVKKRKKGEAWAGD